MNTLNPPAALLELLANALFQGLQLITRLLSSTVNLVQTYQKPIGYQVMFFVGAICQQNFSPILGKFQHFRVENCIEKT